MNRSAIGAHFLVGLAGCWGDAPCPPHAAQYWGAEGCEAGSLAAVRAGVDGVAASGELEAEADAYCAYYETGSTSALAAQPKSSDELIVCYDVFITAFEGCFESVQSALTD